MTRIPRIGVIAWIAACALALLQAAIAGFLLASAHNSAIVENGRAVAQVARSAESSVNRVFLQVDAMLLGLGNLLSLLSRNEPLHSLTVGRLLDELNNQSFNVRDIVIYDAQGRPKTAAVRVSKRHPPELPEEFMALADDPASGLLIGNATTNPRTGDWSLFVGRSLLLANGDLCFVLAEIPLYTFVDVFSASGSRLGISVQLERSDGRLLAVVPHDEDKVGRIVPTPIPTDQLSGEPVETKSRLTGEEVIAASRAVSYRPLIVRASINRSRALAAWSRELRIGVVISALFAALLMGSAALVSRFLRLREATQAETTFLQRTLKSAIESMTEGFVLFGPDDRLITCNSRYLELFPHLREVAVPGTPFRAFAEAGSRAVMPDESEERRREWVEWRIALHRSGFATSEQVLADGRVVHTVVWRTPDQCVATSFRDITVEREQQRQLRHAKESAEAANRAKSAFLASMSHELRTPLNAIIGFSELIRERLHGDQAIDRYADYAGDIHTSARHLLTLINDVLDLSKIEAGRIETVTEGLVLADLAENCLAMVRSTAREKQITLELAHSGDERIVSDERLLTQILLNLLSNAVKFTPEGGRVRLEIAARRDDELRVVVSDNGIGMTDRVRKRLFEPFQQGDATIARRFGGTGLGLAIVAGYVKLLHGSIEVESALGEGTTIAIRIPLAETDADTAEPAAEERSAAQA